MHIQCHGCWWPGDTRSHGFRQPWYWPGLPEIFPFSALKELRWVPSKVHSPCHETHICFSYSDNIAALVQERHNSSVLAMELCLSCINPAMELCLSCINPAISDDNRRIFSLASIASILGGGLCPIAICNDTINITSSICGIWSALFSFLPTLPLQGTHYVTHFEQQFWYFHTCGCI